MKLLVTLILAASALTPYRQRRSGGHGWGYSDHHGADWAHMGENSCDGSRQSPIDIPAETGEKPGVSFNTENYDKEVNWEGINNGHAVQLTLKSDEKLKVTGGDLPGSYLLAQFHFHWGSATEGGSEHLTGGHRHFAEIHLVHTKEGYDQATYMAEGDGLGVLGFFVDVGATEEGPLDDLIQNKIAKTLLEPQAKSDITFELATIIPALDDYYRYLGSLTTPSCNEVVVWSVFKNPILISQKTKDLMVSFAEFDASDVPLVQNFRAAQNLAGRSVTYYSPDVTEEKAMPETGESENDPNEPLSNGNNTEPVGLQVTEQPSFTDITNTTAAPATTPTGSSSRMAVSYSFIILIPIVLFVNL